MPLEAREWSVSYIFLWVWVSMCMNMYLCMCIYVCAYMYTNLWIWMHINMLRLCDSFMPVLELFLKSLTHALQVVPKPPQIFDIRKTDMHNTFLKRDRGEVGMYVRAPWYGSTSFCCCCYINWKKMEYWGCDSQIIERQKCFVWHCIWKEPPLSTIWMLVNDMCIVKPPQYENFH